jgi:hypothetical protein
MMLNLRKEIVELNLQASSSDLVVGFRICRYCRQVVHYRCSTSQLLSHKLNNPPFHESIFIYIYIYRKREREKNAQGCRLFQVEEEAFGTTFLL